MRYLEAWCDVPNRTNSPGDSWNLSATGRKGTIKKTGWAKFIPNKTKSQLIKEGWGDNCGGKSGTAPRIQVNRASWWNKKGTLKRTIGIKDFDCTNGKDIKGTLIWEPKD